MSTGRRTDESEPSTWKGILVAIEGIDGAGKTTQAKALFELLHAKRLPAVLTKEPTNGPWGKKIRSSAATGRLPLHEELQAFIEDRKEHVQSELLPALVAGNIVIVDRYYFSTVAYQGARGIDPAQLLQMNAFAPKPDVLFVLDVSPKLGLSRVSQRGDVPDLFEKEDELTRAREIFKSQAIAAHVGPALVVLDGEWNEDKLRAIISERVFEASSARTR